MPGASSPLSRKILVLNERDLDNPLAGGAEVHIFEIFSRFVRRGHQVTVLCAGFPGASKRAVVRGVTVRRLGNRYLYYALVPWIARRMFRREGFDVVVDVLNKLPFLSPWLVGRPAFAIVHHLFGDSAFRQVPFLIALATRCAETLIPAAYRSTPMMAISPSTKRDLCERGVDPAHIRVVPPGFDHAMCEREPAGTAANERGEREKVVLWVGRMEPYKRADVLIDAIPSIRERVPGVRFVFVGAGSVDARLKQSVRDLGAADVARFTGYISETEKMDLLAAASVVVNTSEKEGWGLTVIEGNAFGVPSVSSDVPGLRDSTRDEETGLLYPFADSRALADAVVRVLGDDALHARLSGNARAWAENFTWDRVAEDTEALIEAAIVPGGEPPRLASRAFAD